MASDKYTKENVRNACDKAEFLDYVNKHLPDCRRAVVLFEKPGELPETSDFRFAQVGYTQVYEVLGFLDFARDYVYNNDSEDDTE